MAHERLFMLRPSLIEGAGVGCFSLSPLPGGTPLSDEGQGFRRMTIDQVPPPYLKYCVLLPSGLFLAPLCFLSMNVFWYVNHSRTPNLVFENGRLYAARHVDPEEELCVYYPDLLTHPCNRAWVREEHI